MENFKIGDYIKNGGNRYFYIAALKREQVILEECDGTGHTGRIRLMDRSSFEGLVRVKTYTRVRMVYRDGRFMEKTDMAVSRSLGLERLLTKQSYSLR